MQTTRLSAWLLAALASASAWGCVDEPCDPGQRLSQGACQAIESAADGGEDAEAGDAADAATPGAACADDPGCTAPYGYCALQPGATEGYCTATGCEADPGVCPAGWTCDTRFVTFGAPDFCSPP